MANELPLGVRLYVDAQRFDSGMRKSSGVVSRFSNVAKREMAGLGRAFSSVQGRLASLGVTVGATAVLINSAKMDKALIQIGQTAGVGKDEIAGLRKELFRMGGETGTSIGTLREGFAALVASGLTFHSSLAALDATNKAVAVTGASTTELAAALAVAGSHFNFDLSKPGVAVGLLDKMTVAGRLANAELKDLPSIFARVGPNAKRAGMSVEQTLGFVEALSLKEMNPERLATLADSTLRIFTNATYRKNATAGMGMKGQSLFFNAKGEQRDAVAVLQDIQERYKSLGTDLARENFLAKVFEGADLDTIKGLSQILGSEVLGKIKEFTSATGQAGGQIAKDLDKALDNANDQVGRLRNKLGAAADSFAQPINDTISKLIKLTIDDKSKGGLGLSGGEIIGAGLGAVAGGALAYRFGGKALQGLLGKAGGLGAGVATGAALEQAAGVQPVFVVNMPAGGLAGGALGPAGKTAGAALALRAGGVGLAGLAGVGVGSLINRGLEGTATGDRLGEQIARRVAFFGSDEAQTAVESATGDSAGRNRAEVLRQALAQVVPAMGIANKISGLLRIEIDGRGQARVKELRSDTRNLDFEVDTGRTQGAL